MQLFSRKKALVAVSLSALAALGACGDNVTVPVAPAASVLITITPPSLNMNVGERANFAVSITGGSTTTPPTLASCTSSNTAVATAASAGGNSCAVTAVAPGNATITAATSTNNVAAAAVSVAAISPAITSLAVSPSAAQLAVGQSITLVGTVQPAGRTVAFTYATSSAAIATVSAAGVVAAIAPGVATITVTAAGSGTGFSNASISQAVTITVSDRVPGLTALNVQPNSLSLALGQASTLVAAAVGPSAGTAVITYGTTAPTVATVSATGVVTAVAAGTAVITVTATSAQSGSFAASTLTALVPVTVAPAAQVVINSLTDNGATIDITNVIGQFEVNLSVNPNGQNVSSVQTWVCNQGETLAACQARTNNVPAAQQSFGGQGAQGGAIQLYINSAEFTTPDFVPGADANTLYKNGLKTMFATVTTVGSTAPSAQNNISQINFNNPDGWTISWTQPTNRINDANGITWYGGPSTPDALTPSATSGDGSFTVVPVIYTAGRTIASAELGINGLTLGTSATTNCSSAGFNAGTQSQQGLLVTARPFTARYGSGPATGNYLQCGSVSLATGAGGVASNTDGYVPSVSTAIDNNNANLTGATGGTPAAGTSIFTQINNSNAVVNVGRYRTSLAYRPSTIYIPGDYSAPDMTLLSFRSGAATVENGWLNGAYIFGAFDNNGNSTSYVATDVGVGIVGSGDSQRNVRFNFCSTPAVIPTSANSTASTNCAPAVATASAGILDSVGGVNLPESANLTNSAYFVQAFETDRLGNRRTSRPFSWANANGTHRSIYPGTTTNGSNTTQAFYNGVDRTAPVVVAIPNSGGNAIANFSRTDVDSIYATTASGLNTGGAIAAEAALFSVRFTDSRSGFPTCTNTSSNCFGNNTANARGGNFQITRRTAPPLATIANTALVESLNNSGTGAGRTFRNSIDAMVAGYDNSVREFSILLSGAAGRNNVGTPPANIGAPVDGYYTFSGTLIDRAGNQTVLAQRSAAIDNSSPVIASLTAPAVLTGGTSVSFTPTASDGLETVAGDLALTYGQLGKADGTLLLTAFPTVLRFRRAPNFAFWHNPFQSVMDNLLATPVGQGTTLGSSLVLPIPFIQQLITVNAVDAPIAPATYAGYLDQKPSAASARVFDIRSTSTQAFTDFGRSTTSATVTIAGGQVPTSTRDYTNAVGGAGVTSWAAFNPTSATLEFRATTSTSITNAPFAAVYIVRTNGTEWEFLGTATNAGTLDQGANRFYRYTFSFAGLASAQGNIAGLTNGDVVRAIGVDASGNAISSRSVTFGLPDAIPSTATFSLVPAPATMNNGGAAQAIVFTNSNPNIANIVYSCSSNSTFVIATMTGPTTCTLTANGVAASTFNVDITFSATGSLAGFNTNTRTSTVTISRQP